MTTQEEPMSVPVAGLPGVEALARANHERGECNNWAPGYWSFDAKFGSVFDEVGDTAHHVRDAERTLAALSPTDRLEIAGITEDRLAGALRSWWLDAKPNGSTHACRPSPTVDDFLAALSETPR